MLYRSEVFEKINSIIHKRYTDRYSKPLKGDCCIYQERITFISFSHWISVSIYDLDTTIWRSANETGGIQRCKLNFGTSPNTKYTYSSICSTVCTFCVYCKYLSTSYKFQSPNWRTPPQESPIYTEDRIGLKTLDESGRLHLMAVEGNHLEFSRQWFIDEIINVYLKN